MHDFQNFKFYNICPQILQNSTKEMKSKTGARFESATHGLLASHTTDWATPGVINFNAK